MSQYYNSQRSRNLFDPMSAEPFRLSRSKIDLFVKCPRCFYMDRRLGVGQPPGYPFSLNSAVDALLKKEFDIHRAAGTSHPLMEHYGIDAIPLAHEKIDEWRDSLRRGITFTIDNENVVVTGGVDDVWVTPGGEFIIVDYKATSKAGEVNLDAEWQDGYKRQMEIYQWILRKNGYRVQDRGYFVYCRVNKDNGFALGNLSFDIKVQPYDGNADWVDSKIIEAKKVLDGPVPESSEECSYCKYTNSTNDLVSGSSH